MADEFDRFLSEALAPGDHAEDRLFVARVQAAIRIDDQLQLQRQAMLRNLVLQLVALAAVAAAALWVGKAPAVSVIAADSPWMGTLILIAGFGSLVGLLTASVNANWKIPDISVA